MSLIVDGKAALAAMLANPVQFVRIRPADWSLAAVKLARKQLVAAGQGINDIRAIREALGADVFNKTLDSLTATQSKQLAARIDPQRKQRDFANGAAALAHIHDLLDGKATAAPVSEAPHTVEPDTLPTANPYLGRRAFRTGR